MKKYKKAGLLNRLKQASESDFSKLPEIVFMRHLEERLELQFHNFGWKLNERYMKKVSDIVLGNINIDFSMLGSVCSLEDSEYLYELAILVAKCVWKMYNVTVDAFGFDTFTKRIQEFKFSLPEDKKGEVICTEEGVHSDGS